MKALALALAVALAACAPTAKAPEAPLGRAESGLEQVPVTITSSTGTHRFIAEVARSPDEQKRGMMFRESIAPDRAMIFPYDPPEPTSFWMENTLIPLDIIFIRPGGTIARIATAVPLSQEMVPSGEPVSAVLEIAGGRAAQLGVKAGDRVKW
ncbi:MAG: DUF192 domain-containing protein [Sphingomonas sp.]|nr:DUF192 domain-containing protein [Sphingomonas sp.]